MRQEAEEGNREPETTISFALKITSPQSQKKFDTLNRPQNCNLKDFLPNSLHYMPF